MTSRERYQYRRENHLCCDCGKPLGESKHIYCSNCLKYRAMYRRARQKQGLCVWCNATPEPGRVLCAACAEKNRQKSRAFRERMKKGADNGGRD